MKLLKEHIVFIFWVFLLVAWNFGVPNAEPWQDVVVAILLSFLVKALNRHGKK